MSIYMIRSIDSSIHDFYIGSTEDMITRNVGHKSRCNNENSECYNFKVYQEIRANGGWDNWEMVEIASVWKKATKTLFQIEQDYIDSYRTTLNNRRAYNGEEYDKEYDKEYRKKYGKKYYEKNKDVIKEKTKEYGKKYRKKNYDIINEKFICDCGGKYVKANKARHLKTKKHQDYISNNRD